MQTHPDLRLLRAITDDLDIKIIRQSGGSPEMSDATGALDVNQLKGGPWIDGGPFRDAMRCKIGGELDQGKGWIG